MHVGIDRLHAVPEAPRPESAQARDAVTRAKPFGVAAAAVTATSPTARSRTSSAVEGRCIRAYVPLSEVGHRPGTFRDTDFVSDAQDDSYRCPGNERLRFISRCERTHRRVYAAPAAACAACALRAQCTAARRGRRVGRHFDEAYLERVRGYHAAEAYAKAMRKRKVWVEPLFVEAKAWHGLGRFRLRGLRKVNGEALLIAAGQNLKRLLSQRGWGRRPWPSGATAEVLPAARPTAASLR